MKRSLVLLLGACMGTLIGCSAGTPTDVAENRQANFTNGDFENGDLTGWTVTTHLNYGLAVPPPKVPTKISDLALQSGGSNLTRVVSGATAESVYANGLSGTDTLKYPRFGKYSVVVNEQGKNYNANEMTQQLTTTAADIDPSDNKIHVRFVLAPVLFDGGHPADQQPYFYLELRNTSKNTQLFASYNYAAQKGVPFKTSAASGYYYTDWQLFDVPFDSTQLAVGETVLVDIVAAGCAQSGHWGELYIDGFGTFIPSLTVAASAPSSVVAGYNLPYTFQVNNGGSATANGVTVFEVLPAGTTFVAVSGLPAGASCTTPAVGGTGNVTCALGSLAAGASTNYVITVNVNQTATGTIVNGNYNVAGTGISPLIGPLVTTTIVPSYLITATVTGGNGTLTCQSPAATGSNSVCSITPAPGYGLATLTLDGNTDVLTAVNGNTYTIVNVTAAHTVTASFGQVARFNITASVSGGHGSLVCQTPVAPGASSICVISPDSGYALSTLALDGKDVTAMVNGSSYTVSNVMSSHSVQAVFAPAKYIITSQVLGGNGTLTCTNTLTSGQNSTCTITPNSGYVLSGLYLDGNDVLAQASGNSYTITNVMASHLVQAIFVVAQFNISASVPGGHGTLSCQTPVQSGQSSICTITPDSGYTLTGLTNDGTNVFAAVSNNIYTIGNVTASHAVQATFGPATYNITTAVPDGNGTLSCTSPLASGQNSTCTITPAAGYGLASLTLDGNSVIAAVNGNTYTITNVTASHLVQATFSTSSYNITATVPGGNGTLTCQSPVASGASSVCTITPAKGFVLSALTLDGSDDLANVNGNSYTIPNVTSSHTVSAAFVPAQFTVTATVPGGHGTLMCSSPVVYGSDSGCMITPDEGYVLVSLTLDGANVTSAVNGNGYTVSNVVTSHIVQANFAMAPYKITALVPGGNGQLNCTTPVLNGATAVCQIIPDYGYILSGITVDGKDALMQVNGNSLSIPNVTSDHTVQGVFAVSMYTITTSVPGGHGTISCTAIVSQGGSSTCTITSENGYLLNTLTLDGTNVIGQVTTNTLTISNITASHLVQGTFMLSANVITIDIPGGHGTITCTGPVLYGQAALCQVTPAPGYHLGTLTLDGVNYFEQVSGNSFPIYAVTAPHLVRGTFVANPQYDITVNILGGNGMITCTTPVVQGQTATCMIAPAPGYVIDTLTLDGVDSRVLVQGSGFSLYNVMASHTVAGSFKRSVATGCLTAADCGSGVCSDGVCCNRACDGQCEACDVSGSVGTCSTISGAPHVNHPSCGEFMCSEGACVTSCTADSECIPGAVCSQGTCTKGSGSLSGGGITGCSTTNNRNSAGAGAFAGLVLLAFGLLRRRSGFRAAAPTN